MAASGASIGGGVGAIVGGAIGLISSLVDLFAESERQSEERKKELEEYKRNIALGEININQLYRERYEWAQKIGESTLEYIKREGEELKKQKEANVKDYEDTWAKLQGGYYVKKGTPEEYNLNVPDPFKGVVSDIPQRLLGLTYEEIELLYEQGLLHEDAIEYFEKLRDLKEEGLDIDKMQLEYAEKVREITTGSPYSGIVNGIVEGFKAGKRSAADFAETFDELMQKAVVSALTLLADEKMRKWYEDFAAMGADGYTEEEIARAKEDYLRYVGQLGEDAKALEKVTGIVIGGTGSDSENTLKGAYAKASQESIDLLAGQTGAQRVAVEGMYSLLKERLTPNTEFINSALGYLVYVHDIQAAALVELRGIRELNARISESNARISELSVQISDNTKRSANALDNIGQNGLKVNIPVI
jgi:hypothetical protein